MERKRGAISIHGGMKMGKGAVHLWAEGEEEQRRRRRRRRKRRGRRSRGSQEKTAPGVFSLLSPNFYDFFPAGDSCPY